MKQKKKLRGSSQQIPPVTVTAKTELQNKPEVAAETFEVNAGPQNQNQTGATAPEGKN
jgi:hypothetical protein